MSTGFENVGVHATMVLDAVRVDAFARAIAETVKPGDVVVDVGSGSGILAVLAARAGARRVYAIEHGPMAEVLALTVADNGMQDVIEVMHCDARDAVFALPPDVIVSETLGSLGVDEDALAILLAVRGRCAPDCKIIPQRVEVVLALVESRALKDDLDGLEVVHGVQLRAVRARVAEIAAVGIVDPAELLSGPVSTSFEIGAAFTPERIGGAGVVLRDGTANAIGAWFRAELSPGVSLSTSPGSPRTSWSIFKLPLDPPIACKAGAPVELEIRPRVVTNHATWTWSAQVGPELRRTDAMRPVLARPQAPVALPEAHSLAAARKSGAARRRRRS